MLNQQWRDSILKLIRLKEILIDTLCILHVKRGLFF